MTTICTVVALVMQKGWNVRQLDVETAFLNGDFHIEVYVPQPPGFAIARQEHKVCQLHKPLYGLKQAPHSWYEKIHTHLIAFGFECSPIESTLYVRKHGADLTIVVLYVDDMLLTGSSEEDVFLLKADLNQCFDVIDLGLLHYYLGIQFDSVEGDIVMHQAMYIEMLL